MLSRNRTNSSPPVQRNSLLQVQEKQTAAAATVPGQCIKPSSQCPSPGSYLAAVDASSMENIEEHRAAALCLPVQRTDE